MNNKMIAVIVAISMVAVALSGAMALGQSDAAVDQDEIYTNGTIQVTNSATRELKVNQMEFSGYNYTLTWKAATLSNSELESPTWGNALITSTNSIGDNGMPSISYVTGTPGSVGGFTVSMSKGDATGAYTLNVSAGGSVTSPSYLGLQCEITVTVGGAEKTLASVYYIYKLLKVDSASYTITLQSMDMTTNTTFGSYVTETSNFLGDRDNYYWYAVGLPAGISMSDSGYVSGVPLEATEPDYPAVAKVVATDKSTGDVYEGTLSITVLKYTQTVSGFYFELEVEEQEAASVDNGSSFAVVQGEEVILKTYSGTSPDGILTDVNGVTAISSDGEEAQVDSTNDGEYVLSTSGTGAYRIVVNVGDESETTVSFYLFVIPSLDNISAGIIVSGN